MTSNRSDAGQKPPAGTTMAPRAKPSDRVEDEDQDPVGENAAPRPPERRVPEGDKPVGESDHDGSSPYEEPNHRVQDQRDR